MTNTTIACFDLPSPAPEWIRVAPYGSWHHPKAGNFTVGRDQAEQMVANHAQLGIDIVVDFEHQTLTGAKAPAAGWIKQLEARDDGLWARVEWTDEARHMVEAKQYRYYSPVFDFRSRDARSGKRVGVALHSLALTNTPLLARDIPPLAAKLSTESDLIFLSAAPAARSDIMPLKAIAVSLGLAEDADADAIRAKVQEVLAQPSELNAAIVALKAEHEKAKADVATLQAENDGLVAAKDKTPVAAQTTIDELQKQLAEFNTKFVLDAATKSVDEAVAACKVTPAQRDWAVGYAQRDPDGFAAFVAGAPVLVAGKIVPPPPADGSPPLTDEEAEVCEQLDLTAKQFAGAAAE